LHNKQTFYEKYERNFVFISKCLDRDKNFNFSQFQLFLHLKKHLTRKLYDDNDEVQEEFMTWLKGQPAYLYDSGIHKLVPKHNNCLDNAGDYVEK